MTDSVSVNSVQPSEVSKEMVAYLLTASILGGSGHSKAWSSCAGLPIITGCDKDTILSTYAECVRTVANRATEGERAARR